MTKPPQPTDQADLFIRPLISALAGGDQATVQRAAEDAGFRHPESTARHLRALQGQDAFRRHAAEALAAVLAAADPDGALVGLVRYVEAYLEALRRPFDFDPARLGLLLSVFGASRSSSIPPR
jgi:hypothetical protein